jgi:catechol 2,3-dioxygenase-like lactoylglutathione lyase family enzyme
MSSDWEVRSIFHFTVNATDFERSLAFYRLLGFKLLRDNRDVVWPPFVAANFGMKRAQGRGALLAIGPEEHHTRLDLIEWLEPKLLDAQAGVPLDERVPRIIALRTRNVRAAYDDLRAKGVVFHGAPNPPDPRSGIEAVVCCRDPDGNIVELIEYMEGLLGSRIDHLERRKASDS